MSDYIWNDDDPPVGLIDPAEQLTLQFERPTEERRDVKVFCFLCEKKPDYLSLSHDYYNGGSLKIFAQCCGRAYVTKTLTYEQLKTIDIYYINL